MSENYQTKILSNQFVGTDIVQDIVKDFANAGITLESERDETEKAYNFVELIIPTAIIIYFAGPAAKKISEKLAEDGYEAVKKLIGKAFGKKRKLKYELRRANGNVIPPTFSRDLSFSFEFNENFTIVFLMKADASEQEALEHFSMAMTWITELSKSKERVSRLHKFLSGNIGFFGTAYLIHYGGELKFLDWPESSQTKQIQVLAFP